MKIEDLLTEEQISLCNKIGRERAKQQEEDANTIPQARFSNGSLHGKFRTNIAKVQDAVVGVRTEMVGCKILGIEFKNPTQQYITHEPDFVGVTYKSNLITMDCRGSRQTGNIIVRPKRDFNLKNKDKFLFGMSHVLDGQEVKVGYITYGELKDLCENHPEWMKDLSSDAPFYIVPIEFFHQDFGDFGNENKQSKS